MKITFAERKNIQLIEEGHMLSPKFDENGLIPAITSDYSSGEILMHGYMNKEALEKTLLLGECVYFSRSRQKLWHKGEHSGFVQKVKEIRVDDDQDALWLRVDTAGKASCHVGYRSCFYRNIMLPSKSTNTSDAVVQLAFKETKKHFNPDKVYKGLANPTRI